MLIYTKFQDVDTTICRSVQWKTPILGHTCLEEQMMKIDYKTLASQSKNSNEKVKKKKQEFDDDLNICMLNLLS